MLVNFPATLPKWLLTKDPNINRKKSYGMFYKIYRRMRYLRYVRKKKKQHLKAIRIQRREEVRIAREEGKKQFKLDLIEERNRKQLIKDQHSKELDTEKAELTRLLMNTNPLLKLRKLGSGKIRKLKRNFSVSAEEGYSDFISKAH